VPSPPRQRSEQPLHAGQQLDESARRDTGDKRVEQDRREPERFVREQHRSEAEERDRRADDHVRVVVGVRPPPHGDHDLDRRDALDRLDRALEQRACLGIEKLRAHGRWLYITRTR
jgi:hypothetical protein